MLVVHSHHTQVLEAQARVAALKAKRARGNSNAQTAKQVMGQDINVVNASPETLNSDSDLKKPSAAANESVAKDNNEGRMSSTSYTLNVFN